MRGGHRIGSHIREADELRRGRRMIFPQGALWWLLLLLLLPVPWLLRRRRVTFRHAAAHDLAALPRSWAQRARPVVPLLRMIVLALLVLAMARPQVVDERTRLRTKGIAMQLVIDRSGSMDAVDYASDGDQRTRLQIVRDIVEAFVRGEDGRGGRPNDLIGVVAFGTYADSLCPLTFDHDHVARVVQSIEIPLRPDERGTAIGDGLALAVERLRWADPRRPNHATEEITGRVVILLTDGENNSGDIDPLLAAEIAAALDVRVYTVGVGSARGVAVLPSVDPLTGRRQQLAVGIDEELLRQIAAMTGGRYFLATDRASLEAIYREIDALEGSEIEGQTSVDVREAAIAWTPLFGGRQWPPIVLIALIALLCETVLAWTRLWSSDG